MSDRSDGSDNSSRKQPIVSYDVHPIGALYEFRKVWYYLRIMDSVDFQTRLFRQLGHGLHLAELFEYLPEVYLYVKDRRSRFVTVNRPLALIHGCASEEEMIGKTDYDLHRGSGTARSSVRQSV